MEGARGDTFCYNANLCFSAATIIKAIAVKDYNFNGHFYVDSMMIDIRRFSSRFTMNKHSLFVPFRADELAIFSVSARAQGN